MKFGQMMFRENDVRLNNDSEKCRSALWSFANSTIRPYDDSVKWLSAIFFFAKTTIRHNCILAKRRVDEKTSLENYVAPKMLLFFSHGLFLCDEKVKNGSKILLSSFRKPSGLWKFLCSINIYLIYQVRNCSSWHFYAAVHSTKSRKLFIAGAIQSIVPKFPKRSHSFFAIFLR